jgi:homoserine acetyltransferase
LQEAGVPTRFAPLPCIEGHDAFLVDLATFGREIGAFLKSS